MSAIQEIKIRLQSTNALIARYRETLDFPTISPLEAKALKLNMRSLQNRAKRLEEEFLDHAAAEIAEASLAAMAVYRNLWQQAHDEDCPNKAALALRDEEIARLRLSIARLCLVVEREAMINDGKPHNREVRYIGVDARSTLKQMGSK